MNKAKSKKRSFPDYFYEAHLPETGFFLRETHLVIQQAIRMKLRPFGIPPGQARIVNALIQEDGISQIELGRRIGVPPPQIAAALRQLEKSKHVVRKRNSKDQRSIHIFVTKKGRDIRKITQPISAEVTQIALEGLSKSEAAQFFRLMTRIRQNVLAFIDGEQGQQLSAAKEEPAEV